MPRPQETHKTFPTLLSALYVLAVFLGIEILVAAAYIDVFGRYQDGDPVSYAVIVVIANSIVFAGLMKYKTLSFAALFHSGESSSRAVWLLLTIPIVLFFGGLCVLIDDLMALVLILLPMTQDQYDTFARLMANGPAILVALCLVAPLFEEMMFRGIFLRSFLQQYSTAQAIVFSSALFAIAHMNVYQAFSGFITGLFLGWLYSRARSLWPCIIGHATHNLTAFLLTPPFSASSTPAGPATVELAPLGVQLVAVMSVAIGGFLLWKLLGGNRNAAPVQDPA